MNKKILCLFDIDGTLTKARNVTNLLIYKQKIDSPMLSCLSRLQKVADISYVGGSDYSKIREQLTEDGLSKAAYVFSENGLVARKGSELIG